MLFSSLTFLFIFLPLVLLFYFITPTRNCRNLILLLFSLVFYAWGEPVYIILMLVSIVFNYLLALLISYFKLKNNRLGSLIALGTAIMINVGLLGYFKYANFIVKTINYIFNINIVLRNISLPIGISFFTFQALSYIVDVYWDKVKATKNLLVFGTYIALFPQLIAGPIVRYETIQNELITRKESWDDVLDGIRRFIIGLGKKIIIANQTAIIADAAFGMDLSNLGMLSAWLGILAYTLQIYFDFSGYSDMAIGLGKVFGFTFLENFNYPYISQSVTEFWRRWHISLSSWFRDYIYIPLGGNKVSKFRWIVNIFIVWFLTGLWHGAAWNFVLWGLYFGVFLVFEKLIILKYLERMPKVVRHIYTILLVVIGWVIFRSESIFQVKYYLWTMFGGNKGIVANTLLDPSMYELLPVMFLGVVSSLPLFHKVKNELIKKPIMCIGFDLYLILILFLCIMNLVNKSFNPFIYYRF